MPRKKKQPKAHHGTTDMARRENGHITPKNEREEWACLRGLVPEVDYPIGDVWVIGSSNTHFHYYTDGFGGSWCVNDCVRPGRSNFFDDKHRDREFKKWFELAASMPGTGFDYTESHQVAAGKCR